MLCTCAYFIYEIGLHEASFSLESNCQPLSSSVLPAALCKANSCLDSSKHIEWPYNKHDFSLSLQLKKENIHLLYKQYGWILKCRNRVLVSLYNSLVLAIIGRYATYTSTQKRYCKLVLNFDKCVLFPV